LVEALNPWFTPVPTETYMNYSLHIFFTLCLAYMAEIGIFFSDYNTLVENIMEVGNPKGIP